jgi:hypothetical protein
LDIYPLLPPVIELPSRLTEHVQGQGQCIAEAQRRAQPPDLPGGEGRRARRVARRPKGAPGELLRSPQPHPRLLGSRRGITAPGLSTGG